MGLHLLYPASPFNPKVVDDDFLDEFQAALDAGLAASIVDESFSGSVLNARPHVPAEATVVYRGWMLRLDAYARLAAQASQVGATLLTSPAAYAFTHHLPNWLPACRDLTARTEVFDSDSDWATCLPPLTEGWRGYFVKDWVKSLSTGRGSVAHFAAEVGQVVELLKQYRGELEGGICVRELTTFRPDTEQRYFVVRGVAYGPSGEIPPLVAECARRVSESQFYSVDVAALETGELQLVELGDGQVSDRKAWPMERFIRVLQALDE